MTAAGIDPSDILNIEDVLTNLDYLENTYIPSVYKIHNIKPQGYITINPISKGIIDRSEDLNYYKTIMKIDRKARIILKRRNLI